MLSFCTHFLPFEDSWPNILFVSCEGLLLFLEKDFKMILAVYLCH